MKRFIYLLLIGCYACSSSTEQEPQDQHFLQGTHTWTYRYTNESTNQQATQTDKIASSYNATFFDANSVANGTTTVYLLDKEYISGTHITSIGGAMCRRGDTVVVGKTFESGITVESYLPIATNEVVNAPINTNLISTPYSIKYLRDQTLQVPAGTFSCRIYRMQISGDVYYTEVAVDAKNGIVSESAFHVVDGLVEKRELVSIK